MELTPSIEDEDSFMIIPNKFVKDHELTQEEIKQLMTPDPEYEAAMRAKYPSILIPPKPSIFHYLHIFRRTKNLIKKIIKFAVKNDPEKILDLKLRWNRFRGRSLPSRW